MGFDSSFSTSTAAGTGTGTGTGAGTGTSAGSEFWSVGAALHNVVTMQHNASVVRPWRPMARERKRATHFRRLDRKEAAGAWAGPGAEAAGAGDAAGTGVEARTEATTDGAPVVAVGMTRLERDGLRLFDAPRARLGVAWCNIARHAHNTTQHTTRHNTRRK